MLDTTAVLDFHERTKLHPGAGSPRRVDAALIPRQHKRYVDLPSIPLPPPAISGRTLFDILAQPSAQAQTLTLESLSAVLHYAGGIVRRSVINGREVVFRAASCTGALYHIELYVVCGDLPGALPAGLYHYDVPSESLRPLRDGDYRSHLAHACQDPSLASAGASVVLTSTFWRNAWRYQERAYRHVFWDGGTVLANLLAIAEGHGLRPSLRAAFLDEQVNALLGVESRREAAIAVVPLGAESPARQDGQPAPLQLETEPLSRAEIEYPLIWQTHEATSLPDVPALRDWQHATNALTASRPYEGPVPADALSLETSIETRRSARRFSEQPLARAALDAVLAATSARTHDGDSAGDLIQPMLIVNRVEGLAPGVYRAGRSGDLTLVREGDLASEAEHLALDQAAAGNAAVNLYFVANAGDVAALGERAYRLVQLEAGVRTGRAYLVATALGLRATGLTFYDDEVARSLGLEPDETMVLMLVALGR